MRNHTVFTPPVRSEPPPPSPPPHPPPSTTLHAQHITESLGAWRYKTSLDLNGAAKEAIAKGDTLTAALGYHQATNQPRFFFTRLSIHTSAIMFAISPRAHLRAEHPSNH